MIRTGRVSIAILGGLAALLFVTTAQVQAQSAEAGKYLPMVPQLTLKVAETMALAAEQYGKDQGFNPLNIAVVDEQGNLIYFRRDRNSFRGSAEIAMNKAWTSAKFPLATRFIGEKIVNRDPEKVHGLQFMDRLVIFPGGLPVMAGEFHIGAIGVSGATGDQDESCAQAGLDAVQDLLKVRELPKDDATDGQR